VADPVVLALDTSTSVAVGVARGAEVLGRARLDDRMAHVEQLVPLLHHCLADAGLTLADVDAVVVGLGPGPFTGLRVGIVSAQVLAAVRDVPLHGVCSLDAVAAAYADERDGSDFVVATDARRREVYWARYAADGRRQSGPDVSAPDLVPRLPTVGPAADLYPERLAVAPGPRRLDPGVLAVRGLTLPDAGTEPLYLRRPDAAEPTRRKSVLSGSAHLAGTGTRPR
jgi:tRNA threonylcarbamoyl adenosine modification protein YeaZ